MVLLPPALLVFYVLAVEQLGFLPTAAHHRPDHVSGARRAHAFWPCRWRSVRRCSSIWSSAKLLRVPLPSGLLPLPWLGLP